MAGYRIYFRKSTAKELEKLPKSELSRIVKNIELLAEDPKPQGCEKLSGETLYRVRQGDYRIVYSIQDNELTIWVVKIGHRKDVYRK